LPHFDSFFVTLSLRFNAQICAVSVCFRARTRRLGRIPNRSKAAVREPPCEAYAQHAMLNELRSRGVDEGASIVLDRVPSMQLDDTEAPLAALLVSCQDAASQVRRLRGGRQEAVFIARVSRTRARYTSAQCTTLPNCARKVG
jgi:hypothetical protein